MKMIVRAATPADYPVLVALNKAAYPDYGETEEEWRHWDETWDHQKYFKSRVVAEEGGRVFGFGLVKHMRWAFVQTEYRINIIVHHDQLDRGHWCDLTYTILEQVQLRDDQHTA